MRATARRENGTLQHAVEIRDHTVTADEPKDSGGGDTGPSPQELLAASLASCTAITMEMYAQRKRWDIGEVTVDVNYEPAQRGSPTRFSMVVSFPKELPEDQRERLMQIGAKCPVHRVLEGEVMFEETVELV
jgi:putative redox protein